MLTILQGDALEKLRELPDESVQCCVTSPPYWGLRDYGTATWNGGDAQCDHLEAISLRRDSRGGFHNSESRGTQPSTAAVVRQFRGECGKCGAKRIDSQIGLEETPDAYVAKMVEVFREVRRVLRGDGTLWMNLGDCYIHDRFSSPMKGDYSGKDGLFQRRADPVGIQPKRTESIGLKTKDLCGIPWMVAFALRADGWYLRSDIIWHKPNPMPESVTDRPTKAHEYLFLMSKRERYFYDAEAISEPKECFRKRGNGRSKFNSDRGDNGDMAHFANRDMERGIRNKRSVWTVATAPYSEAHFATYPPDLIKPCILAGSKAGDTILDPFAGSGTTGMVAIELGRKTILIELNPSYIPLIEQRCTITPGFTM